VQYLLAVLQYPKTMVALEKEIVVNGLTKRFDIVVYDRSHRAWMLVECKAPHVGLSEDVLQQALRYNLALPVQYLVITNGENTVGWKRETDRLHRLETLPIWEG
ncbi:MAG: type I restriction enzyme HsdR N-terminal domain-containing protein, partial [Bacteroidota bacterium]|nr:type I restriction enzyme HsdR N-terminal domain-containing protein [Bacteroidota bacterium]